MQGTEREEAQALSRGTIPPTLPEPEQRLLRWVELLTRTPHRNTAEEVAQVRAAGWSDSQIAEASYTTALFAMFNRVADAFGLIDPRYDELQVQPASLPTTPPT